MLKLIGAMVSSVLFFVTLSVSPVLSTSTVGATQPQVTDAE
jgi:hypothetical protein